MAGESGLDHTYIRSDADTACAHVGQPPPTNLGAHLAHMELYLADGMFGVSEPRWVGGCG